MNRGIDSQVIQYLDTAAPTYALLLRGSWGVGKSFYWKRFVNSSFPKEKREVTFSVAGLVTLDELERALFLASIQDIGSDLLQEAGTVVGRALLRWVKIDPNDIRLKADVRSGTTVICIDDVERFAGDVEILFGFIISLIDGAVLHVVLIADEERALQKFPRYADFKERIVRRSLNVPLALDEFYDYVVNGFAHQQTREALLDIRQDALALFVQKDIRNLRTVRSILDQIKDILSGLTWPSGKRSSISNLLSALTFSTMALAKSAANGALVRRIFRQADLGIVLALREQASRNQGPNGDDSEGQGLSELIEALGFRSESYGWPTSPDFAAYAVGESFLLNEIARDFKIFGETEAQEPPLLDRFRTYRTMEEGEFRQLLDDLQKAVSSRQFVTVHDLWTAFDIAYHLAQARISGQTPEECRDEFLNVVDQYAPEAIQNSSLEIWPEHRDANQKRVLDAVRLLERRSRDNERIVANERLRNSLLNGIDPDPADSLLSPFAGCDPLQIYSRLVIAGRSSTACLRRFYAGRSRILGIPETPDEALFASGLAQVIEDNLREATILTLDQSSMFELAGVLRQYAQTAPGATTS